MIVLRGRLIAEAEFFDDQVNQVALFQRDRIKAKPDGVIIWVYVLVAPYAFTL
jgi:hypothetical protein